MQRLDMTNYLTNLDVKHLNSVVDFFLFLCYNTIESEGLRMWEESTEWIVSWSGTTIWGHDYSDSKCFDDEQIALAFCVKLGLSDTVDYINFEKSTIWRKKKKRQ